MSQQLPNLAELSHTDKDELILRLLAELALLMDVTSMTVGSAIADPTSKLNRYKLS